MHAFLIAPRNVSIVQRRFEKRKLDCECLWHIHAPAGTVVVTITY